MFVSCYFGVKTVVGVHEDTVKKLTNKDSSSFSFWLRLQYIFKISIQFLSPKHAFHKTFYFIYKENVKFVLSLSF